MLLEECFVIDQGNTTLKLAKMEGDSLAWVERLSDPSALEHVIPPKAFVIYASVASNSFLAHLSHATLFPVSRHPLPFRSAYENQDTVGIDRLCNMAAVAKDAGHPRLVIDMGTCIKFDCINAQNEYLGGSISPGIKMRFESLNTHTEKLPNLSHRLEPWNLIGNSTEGSILSGVLGGVQLEIESRIARYEQQFGALKIYLTGGDLNHFDIGQKNHIFVDEYLTLNGIYALYKKQAI
ncbi:MAG: type III pantothenate kinase [Flavobacteriales bacterium]|jgi:type III pantothenate kinase